MPIEDFGTRVESKKKIYNKFADANGLYPSDEYDEDEEVTVPVQWKISRPGVYEMNGPTTHFLPPGAYTVELNHSGEPQLIEKELKMDDLIEFPNSLPFQILEEIESFWKREEQFREYGYLQRRGYMFYGPQGSGKTSIIYQIVNQIIKSGNLAIFADHPTLFTRGMVLLRKVEPNRPVLCLFEDIDSIIEKFGDSEILQWLDGANQIDRVINIASTNYPEALDRRIVSRPRRFDPVERIGGPTKEHRFLYFQKKLPKVKPDALNLLVDQTSELSFAALAEVIISVYCLGNSIEKTLEILRDLDEQKPSSREYEKNSVGFGIRVTDN